MKHPVIALLTDFGEDDFFVPSLKGVILKINSSARIVDITHHIPSFDIKAGGFILYSCYTYFPTKTIFLVVVDPGVGSSREILLAETKKYFFIAPDNGILSYIVDEEEVTQIREVRKKKYFLPEVSHTFEGRDKMAPAAAWLSKGVPCVEFGPEVTSYESFNLQKPQEKGNEITGQVLYTDKFGNLITNIPERMLALSGIGRVKKKFSLYAGGRKISSFRESYSSAKEGELLFLTGSLGLIEIASREGSASKQLKIKNGDTVRIVIKSEK